MRCWVVGVHHGCAGRHSDYGRCEEDQEDYLFHDIAIRDVQQPNIYFDSVVVVVVFLMTAGSSVVVVFVFRTTTLLAIILSPCFT